MFWFVNDSTLAFLMCFAVYWLVKAKFHSASWFGASSELASVMEFGFNIAIATNIIFTKFGCVYVSALWALLFVSVVDKATGCFCSSAVPLTEQIIATCKCCSNSWTVPIKYRTQGGSYGVYWLNSTDGMYAVVTAKTTRFRPCRSVADLLPDTKRDKTSRNCAQFNEGTNQIGWWRN